MQDRGKRRKMVFTERTPKLKRFAAGFNARFDSPDRDENGCPIARDVLW
jgi:hypothetical protein